jgi:hypothetical protein
VLGLALGTGLIMGIYQIARAIHGAYDYDV